MKDDLRRLLKEFIEETVEIRTVKETVQNTESSEKKEIRYIREATMADFIDWIL